MIRAHNLKPKRVAAAPGLSIDRQAEAPTAEVCGVIPDIRLNFFCLRCI